uniref:Uncharacterized protein n=1 Tax=Parascaris equorum TaxID=6256 RepID=A0A914REU5_PAREQ
MVTCRSRPLVADEAIRYCSLQEEDVDSLCRVVPVMEVTNEDILIVIDCGGKEV